MNWSKLNRREVLGTLGAIGGILAFRNVGVAGDDPGETIKWPEPLKANLLPQPDNDISGPLAFGMKSRRIAISSGKVDEPRVYVQNRTDQGFKVLWKSEMPESAVYELAWSRAEDQVALLAVSMNRVSPTHGELCLYALSPGDGSVTKVLTVEKQAGGRQEKQFDLTKGVEIAWYDAKTICIVGKNNEIYLIDTDNGKIVSKIRIDGEGLVCSIQCLADRHISVLQKKALRDVQGCELKLSEVVDGKASVLGSIELPNAERIVAGKFDQGFSNIIISSIRDRFPWIIVYDMKTKRKSKEIAAYASKNGDYYHYVPFAASDRDLILGEILVAQHWRERLMEQLQKDTKSAALVAGIDIRDMARCRVVSLPLAAS